MNPHGLELIYVFIYWFLYMVMRVLQLRDHEHLAALVMGLYVGYLITRAALQ